MNSKYEALARQELSEGLRAVPAMLRALERARRPRPEHWSKIVHARRIGLHYWPALIEPKCDPKAFLAFEQYQTSKGEIPWGKKTQESLNWESEKEKAVVLRRCVKFPHYDTSLSPGLYYEKARDDQPRERLIRAERTPRGRHYIEEDLDVVDRPTGRTHGGWDSHGHWGVNPEFVARAWFAAGCRDGGKLHLQFASGVVAKKGDSVTFFKNYLRGATWYKKSHQGGHGNWEPQFGWASEPTG